MTTPKTPAPPSIPMKDVESSQIKAIGHDPETNTLAIKFHGNPRNPEGSIYHYSDYPAAAFEEFAKAPSIGKHFGQFVKGKYSFNRIS